MTTDPVELVVPAPAIRRRPLTRCQFGDHLIPVGFEYCLECERGTPEEPAGQPMPTRRAPRSLRVGGLLRRLWVQFARRTEADAEEQWRFWAGRAP